MELRYVPRAEFDRIRSLEGDRYERTAAFADACRLNVLYMVRRVGSGHLGTTFSSLEIVSWLHLEVLGQDVGRQLSILVFAKAADSDPEKPAVVRHLE